MDGAKIQPDMPVLFVLCLTLIILPLAFLNSAFDVFGAPKYASLMILAGLSFTFAGRQAFKSGVARLPKKTMVLLLVVLMSCLLLATVFSPVPALSFFGLRKRFFGLATYIAASILLFAAAGIKWDRNKINFLKYSAAGTAMAVSFLGLAQKAGSSFPFDLKALFAADAYSTFGNPAYLGVYLALALPITLDLGLGVEGRAKLIGYPAIVLCAAGLWASGSSGAVVGALIGTAVFAVLSPLVREKLHVKWAKIAAAAVFGVVAVALLSQVGQDTTAINQRRWIWNSSYLVAAQNPLLGHGPENLKSGIQKIGVKPELGTSGIQYEDAHNIWLNFASGAGFPALLFAGLFIASVYRHAGLAWTRDKNTKRALAMLTAAITGYLVTVQFNPEDIGSMPIFWLLLGTTISVAGATELYPIKNSRWPALLIVFASVVILPATILLGAATLTAEITLLRANEASDLETAVKRFQTAQKIQPWQTNYYVFEIYRLLPLMRRADGPLGRELVRAGNKAVASDPNNPEPRLAIGEVYQAGAEGAAANNLHLKALENFEAALSLDRYDARTIRHLAITHRQLGNRKRSLEFVKRYKVLFKNSEELENLRRELSQIDVNPPPS